MSYVYSDIISRIPDSQCPCLINLYKLIIEQELKSILSLAAATVTIFRVFHGEPYYVIKQVSTYLRVAKRYVEPRGNMSSIGDT